MSSDKHPGGSRAQTEQQTLQSGRVTPHPLVEWLRDPPRDAARDAMPMDAVALSGYLKRDLDSADYWRLYDSLRFDAYLRIHEDDIVRAEHPAKPEDFFQTTLVLVKTDARIERLQATAEQEQGRFTTGSLADVPAEPDIQGDELPTPLTRLTPHTPTMLSPRCIAVTSTGCPQRPGRR